MAGYTSSYSGQNIDAVIALFHNKGLGNVTGVIKRNSDGTFEEGESGGGAVTSVGITAGNGISVSGSPVTSSGNITVGHSNSVTAKTTQGLYPIKFDAQGHITGSGNAVTSLPASDVSSWAKASSKPTYTYSEVGAASSSHTHDTTLAVDSGTSSITLASAGKYKLTAGGKSVVFTMPTIPTVNYPVTSVNGQAGEVSLSYADVGAAEVNHTHDTTLKADTGTSSITLASAGKYKLTAGDTSVVFTMPTIPTVNYPVTSVNSKTGAVSLTASDVGAAASNHSHTFASLTSKPTTLSGYGITDAASSSHTHTTSIATSTGTNQLTLAANTKYAITAGGTSYVFTTPPDTNTTYSSKAATSGGTDVSLVTTGEKYTWNNKSNLAIGTTATTAAAGNHAHTASLATSTGTSAITLAHGGKYALTAGGSSVIFTMPAEASVTPTKENIGSASAGTAIAADDITAWSAGSVPSLTVESTTVLNSATVSNNVLTLGTATVGSASGWSAGSVPSLSYTARSIPNISVTSKSVVTDLK